MLVFGEQALLSAALFLALYLGLEWLFVHYPPGFLAAVFGLVFSLFQSLFGRGVSKRRR